MGKLGIDFGTSYSTICALDKDGKPDVIRIDGEEKVPTLVYWGKDGHIEIGEAVLKLWNDSFDYDIAEREDVQARIIRSIKRNFFPGQEIALPGNVLVSPEEIVAKVLSFLLKEGEKYFNNNVHEVTLTCPATFTPQQEDLFRDAIKLAGIRNYTLMADNKFLKEPLAAAIAYTTRTQKTGNGILVYDLGGGTFDLSYVHHDNDGMWRIPLDPTGDYHCGGDDFDRILYEYARQQFPSDAEYFERETGCLNVEILEQCRKLKENLTKLENAFVTLYLNRRTTFRLSRVAFEELIRNKIASTIQNTKQYLNDIRNRGYEVDSVILIGGSSKIPLISRMLGEVLPVKPVIVHNSDIAVAEGAAIYKRQNVSIVEVPVTPMHKVEYKAPPKPGMGLTATGICKECKEPIYGKAFICFECGALQETSRVSQNHIRPLQLRYQKLIKLVKEHKISYDTMWDEVSQRYAAAIGRVRELLKSDALRNQCTSEIMDHMKNMINQCSNSDFHIALVGTIKAGKSSLLNAIIGHEIASTAVTPETASLTKFRGSSDGKDYLKISFYTREEWKRLWASVTKSKEAHPTSQNVFLEEYKKLKADRYKEDLLGKAPIQLHCGKISDLKEQISKWTSSQCPEHYFVKEVEVILSSLHLPPEVVFVDTPGLNDIVRYRSDITREYIRRANAILVCVSSDALAANTLETIIRVFENCYQHPEKIYILGTKIDLLNKPQEDWSNQQECWIKPLKEDVCFNSEDLARRHTFGVSSYIHTLFQKYDQGDEKAETQLILIAIKMGFLQPEAIAHNHNESLSDGGSIRKRLLEFANIERLLALLDEEIISEYKKILLNDICALYELCKKEVMDLMDGVQKGEENLIKTFNSTIEEQRMEVRRVQQQLKDMTEEEKNEQNFQKDFEKGIATYLKHIKDRIRQLTN